MGAIGDQWVRKWGWFISFLGGEGGALPTLSYCDCQFCSILYHVQSCFSPTKLDPCSKWKSFTKSQVETKGELWLIDLGLEVWLLFWFARCSLQGLRMICVPWNVRLQWGRSPNCLWGICRVCLREATWFGRDFLSFWVIVVIITGYKSVPHLPPHPSLALFIIVLLYIYLGSRGVLDFSARALSVELN